MTLIRPLRSERLAAALLLGAAALGLVFANLPRLGPALLDLAHTELRAPVPGLSLTPAHWVSDGLLVLFFFAVAVELRRELAVGELNSVRKAALPAIAAAGGVLVPALVYLAIAGRDFPSGWPIPTATDIAFALGILGLFGRGIPTHVRVFLLALAVIDDLIAILFIAFFFTATVSWSQLAAACGCLVLFALLSRLLAPRSRWVRARRPVWPIAALLWVLAVLTWWFVLRSGVHATIAGVALGFAIARQPGGRMRHLVEPLVNGIVLPLFAFSAAAVALPAAGAGLHSEFWAIAVALPVGKVVGIVGAGLLGARFVAPASWVRRSPVDLVMVGCLGGVGFTVALLMNQLAFRGSPGITDEGVLAVLAGSAVAIVVSSVFVALRARRHRLRRPRPEHPVD